MRATVSSRSCEMHYSLYYSYLWFIYYRYEDKKLYNRQVSARELWFRIITSQIETGMPYVLYKDACNAKSNQKNLGTIKCSNLCTEVIQYTSSEEVVDCYTYYLIIVLFIFFFSYQLYRWLYVI